MWRDPEAVPHGAEQLAVEAVRVAYLALDAHLTTISSDAVARLAGALLPFLYSYTPREDPR